MDSPTVRRQWADRVAVALGELLAQLAAEVAPGPGDGPLRYRSGLDRFIPLLEEGRGIASCGIELPRGTARFALGGASSLIFDECRAGRGAELEALLPQLVFALTLPYLGVEGAEAEMRRVAAS